MSGFPRVAASVLIPTLLAAFPPSGDISGATDTARLEAIAAQASLDEPLTILLPPNGFNNPYYVTGFPQGTPYLNFLGTDMNSFFFDVGAGGASCLVVRDPNFQSTTNGGGKFGGFVLDGSVHTGTARVGVECGDIIFTRFSDVLVQNYTAASDIGVWLVNKTHWTERLTTMNFNVQNCTQCLVIDQIAGGSVTTSHSYCTLDFSITAEANQDGFTFQHGVTGVGGKLALRGNFFAGTGNTGTAFQFGADGNGGTWSAEHYECCFEADGATGTGHKMYNIGAAADIVGEGTFAWLKGGTVDFTAGNLAQTQTQFAVSGFVYHINGATSPDAMVPQYVQGNGLNANGALGLKRGTTTDSAGTLTVFVYSGDVFALGLANGAQAITFSGFVPNVARRIRLIFKQPGSGAAGTVTWGSLGTNVAGTALAMAVPNGGANPPVLQSANNAWDDLDVTCFDGAQLIVTHPSSV